MVRLIACHGMPANLLASRQFFPDRESGQFFHKKVMERIMIHGCLVSVVWPGCNRERGRWERPEIKTLGMVFPDKKFAGMDTLFFREINDPSGIFSVLYLFAFIQIANV